VNRYERYGWDEERYLAANPDVRMAVEQGVVRDGYHHWLLMGRQENRPGGGFDHPVAPTTRLCFDPWVNAEFTVDGRLKPCCNLRRGVTLDDDAGVAAAHGSELFRDLRHEILTGNLCAECSRCHIRPMVPVEQVITRLFPQLPPGAGLLDGGRAETVRIDVTSRCNLRCVYCALSVEGADPGRHMTDENLERVGRFVESLGTVRTVGVNGHGETTHHPRWREFCDQLIAAGKPLSIITNLGRAYDDDEIATLARFRIIEISIDTADEGLLRRIRRKVDLSRIVTNMAHIRARALMDGIAAPHFSFSCGLYDQSITRLEAFAALAAAVGVRTITFWDLQKYPDLPGQQNVQPLSSLDDEALAEGLACFDRAMVIFTKSRIRVTVAGNFLEPLRARAGRPREVAAS